MSIKLMLENWRKFTNNSVAKSHEIPVGHVFIISETSSVISLTLKNERDETIGFATLTKNKDFPCLSAFSFNSAD